MDWIILALGAAFLWSIMGIIQKFVRVTYFENSLGYLIFIAPAFFFVFVLLFFQPFVLLSLKDSLLAMSTGLMVTVGGYFYIEAIHREEVSRVFIAMSSGPVFTLLLSIIFLGEVLTFNQYLAFALILTGGLLILIRRINKRFSVSTGVLMTLITCFFFALNRIVLKHLSFTNLATIMIYKETGFFITIGAILALYPKARMHLSKVVKDLNMRKTAAVYSAEIIGLCGVFLSYLAIQRGPVSLVAVIERFEVVFLLVISYAVSKINASWIKEEASTLPTKLVSLIVMAAGIYLLY